VLAEVAGMRITCTEVTGTTWRPGVTVYKTGATISLAGSTALPFGTYTITGTFELATGDITLYVDYLFDNSVGSTDNEPTINALPIWRVGAPPASWITDFALFDSVTASPTGDITYIGTGSIPADTATNISPGLPAGIVAGDLLLMAVHSNNNAANHSTPAGWTQILGLSPGGVTGGMYISLFWRYATGSTPAPTVTITGTGSGFISAYRYVHATVPVNAPAAFGAVSGSYSFIGLLDEFTDVDRMMIVGIIYGRTAGGSVPPNPPADVPNGYVMTVNSTSTNTYAFLVANKIKTPDGNDTLYDPGGGGGEFALATVSLYPL
jgi:hypothetical protein